MSIGNLSATHAFNYIVLRVKPGRTSCEDPCYGPGALGLQNPVGGPAHTHIQIHIYTQIHIHTYTHKYKYVHTHTYIHTQICSQSTLTITS